MAKRMMSLFLSFLHNDTGELATHIFGQVGNPNRHLPRNPFVDGADCTIGICYNRWSA
jgi:hypothetical protein